tara:strand:+ start:1059 stop:1661 length:603 start_codon:yes stop_codon:yes gene_type:complete
MNNELVCLNTTNASYRLILIHGWGADAEDLLPLGETLTRDLEMKVEIISLRAPQLHPQGIGRQWYSLFPPNWSEVPIAIEELSARIKAISTKSIPLEKTAILGFSQGGAMALSSGSTLPMAGIICCSAYAHPNWIVPQKMPPLVFTHGQYDEVVPCKAVEQIKNLLDDKYQIDIDIFNGGHEIPPYLLSKFKIVLSKWFD